MALKKKYLILGMIGCLCFSIGNWLLGYVDPAQAEKSGGRELAVTLSGSFGNTGMAALYCVFLLVYIPLVKLIIDILRRKTCLKRTAVLFSPIVPMGVIFIVAQLLPQSPFSYGLYTFCMNGGMLVWFMYLLVVNRKGSDLLCC